MANKNLIEIVVYLLLTSSQSAVKDKYVFVSNFEHAIAYYNNPVKHTKGCIYLLIKNHYF